MVIAHINISKILAVKKYIKTVALLIVVIAAIIIMVRYHQANNNIICIYKLNGLHWICKLYDENVEIRCKIFPLDPNTNRIYDLLYNSRKRNMKYLEPLPEAKQKLSETQYNQIVTLSKKSIIYCEKTQFVGQWIGWSKVFVFNQFLDKDKEGRYRKYIIARNDTKKVDIAFELRYAYSTNDKYLLNLIDIIKFIADSLQDLSDAEWESLPKENEPLFHDGLIGVDIAEIDGNNSDNFLRQIYEGFRRIWWN